ncbi:MAG: hypothetical protein OSJ74_10300, partial [Clostridia bacterium]|nr:hypothetical protein [Clostridia bacterium]
AGFGQHEELYEQAWSVAGLVTAASKLPSLINVVSSIFLQAWSLSSAQESESSDREQFYSTVFKYYSPVIFMATAAVILILPYISKFLLKEGFYRAWTYSPILIMGAVSGCFSAFFGAFFGAYYKSKYSMSIVAKYSGMDNVVYVSIIAFWLSYTVIFLTRVLFARKLVKISADWIKFAIQYLLLMGLAAIYTVDVKYKIVAAVSVLLIIFIVNIKEMVFVLKKFIDILRRKLQKTDNSGAPKAEIASIDTDKCN